MSEVYQATGTKDPGKVARTLMGAGAAGKGFFFAGLQQAIENAEDAGASEVYISLDKKRRIIRIADNGGGFVHKNVDGFFSLMVSPKSGEHGQIGRNGSGRYFLLQFSKVLRVFTKSSDFKSTVTFALEQADVEELLRKDSISRPVSTCDKPEFWDLPGTGSFIVLEGIPEEVWKRIPSAKTVVAEFGRQLKPSIARKVFVNGEPLKPRAVHGDILEKTFEDVKGLTGRNSIYLFIPEQRLAGEEVGLGALNNISTLKEFWKQLPTELRELVPEELVQGRILGDIYIPELNKFRAHDGRSFTDELYASTDMNAVCEFLDHNVRPLIAEKFAEREKLLNKEAVEASMEKLCETIRERWEVTEEDIKQTEEDDKKDDDKNDDDEDTGEKTEEKITVNPRSFTCLPGTKVTFKVTGKTRLLGSLRWEAENSGGKITRRVTLETEYTAGNEPGVYTLIARHPKKPAIFCTIRIRIEAEIALKVTPVRTEIIQGENHVFRAKNIHMTNSGEAGKITWEMSSADGERAKGIRLSSKTGDKVTVRVSDDAILGDYILVCFDSSDPEHHRCEATFEVVEKPDEVGYFVKIEETVYEVVASTIDLDNVVEVGEPRIKITNPGEAPHPTLQVDWQHELIKGLEPGSDMQFRVIIPDLIAAHLQRKVDEDPTLADPHAFRLRLTELRKELHKAQKLEAKEQPENASTDPAVE